MVGPLRPHFVLFGSSIVQFSFGNGGWGAILADLYSRKADIFVRGYAGWNSRKGLQVLEQVFPKDASNQPSLVIVYFSGNDSMLPYPLGSSTNVPLPEYVGNMKKIATHLKSLSPKSRLIFLTAPPVNEEQMRKAFSGISCRRTSEQTSCAKCIQMLVWSCAERWTYVCFSAEKKGLVRYVLYRWNPFFVGGEQDRGGGDT